MKLCRFQNTHQQIGIGLVLDDEAILDLTACGVSEMTPLIESPDLARRLTEFSALNLPRFGVDEVKLLHPIEQQEVWAAGVTYLRSKKARMEESEFSASAYDRVYEAARPELFFKSMPSKVVSPQHEIGIRKDAKWSVPEPELVLVISSVGKIVGFTIGNDMSSRDIEGENLLYLPQAKIYDRSCAIGPWVTVNISEEEARSWSIGIEILRSGSVVFMGNTSVGQIKRTFEELVHYLFQSQTFPMGVALFTGTGVVPPDTFTLEAGDKVRIRISGIGVLENTVIHV